MWPPKREREFEQYSEQMEQYKEQMQQQLLEQNISECNVESTRHLLPSLSVHSESFPPPERLPRPFGTYVVASQLVREPVIIGQQQKNNNYSSSNSSNNNNCSTVDKNNVSSNKNVYERCNSGSVSNNIAHELYLELSEQYDLPQGQYKSVSSIHRLYNHKANIYNQTNNFVKNNSNSNNNNSNNDNNNNYSHYANEQRQEYEYYRSSDEDNIAFGATRISSAKRSAATLSSNGTKRSWRSSNHLRSSSSNTFSSKECDNIKRSNRKTNVEEECIADATYRNNNNNNNDNSNNNNNNNNYESNNCEYDSTSGIAPDESCCVAAVINNGASEVGVALCTFPALHIGIAQFGDTCTFSKTLTLLYTHNPVEVIVPSTAVEEEFTQTLLRTFSEEITFTSVQRRFFNSEEGVRKLRDLHTTVDFSCNNKSVETSNTSSAQVLSSLSVNNNKLETTKHNKTNTSMNNININNDHTTMTSGSVNFEETDKYLCVAAAHALIKYLEFINDFQLLPHSLCVKQIMLEHFAEIPRSSARALHIIPPATGMANAGLVHNFNPYHHNSNKFNNNSNKCYLENNHFYSSRKEEIQKNSEYTNMSLVTCTLTEALPRCATFMGQRFMRSSLLQPLREHKAITARQDVVEWLITEPRRALLLRTCLQEMAGLDVERLIALFAQRPRVHSNDKRRYLIQSLLDFWHACEAAEQLKCVLEELLLLPPEEQEKEIKFCCQSQSYSNSNNNVKEEECTYQVNNKDNTNSNTLTIKNDNNDNHHHRVLQSLSSLQEEHNNNAEPISLFDKLERKDYRDDHRYVSNNNNKEEEEEEEEEQLQR